jgi:hypothetical protein
MLITLAQILTLGRGVRLGLLVAAACAAGAARPESHARAGAPALSQPGTAASESPGARCAREFIGMVNDPTAENVRAFEGAWASRVRLGRASVDDRIPRVAALHDKWGKVGVSEVTPTKDKSVVVGARTESGLWLELSLVMSAGEPGKLDAVEISESTGPVEHRALSAEARTQTVRGVADALRTSYVYPDKGARMADAILGKLNSGEYDAVEGETALARQLTDDCRAVTHDLHLGVRVSPQREGGSDEGMMGPHDLVRRENYAFRKVEVLDGNIGYLRFDGFVEDDEAKRVASSAMSFLSGCDAVIFDVRFNGGGSAAMVAYITSYLFESKTHLNDMVDRDGKVVEEFWTSGDVPGPGPRTGVPVFVLCGPGTFSGAEEFCYNLKNLKRATLVGETTGGGAHPVRDERVNDRFVVRVPFMRAQNPVSGTNWEGTGVEPDVKVSAAGALDKALELARGAAGPRK